VAPRPDLATAPSVVAGHSAPIALQAGRSPSSGYTFWTHRAVQSKGNLYKNGGSPCEEGCGGAPVAGESADGTRRGEAYPGQAESGGVGQTRDKKSGTRPLIVQGLTPLRDGFESRWGRHQAGESTASLPASPFRLLGVPQYAFVTVRSEADKSTALSPAWPLFKAGRARR